MIRSLDITNLSAAAEKQSIFDSVHELELSTEPEKILNLRMKSSKGTIPDALEIIQRFVSSSVDLSIEASGEINPAGLLLSASGKPKCRKATFSTIFMLRDKELDEKGKKKTKDPYATCLIETLCGLGAKRSQLTDIMSSQSFITSIDAKKLRIIDDAGLVKNKYKEEKKKSS